MNNNTSVNSINNNNINNNNNYYNISITNPTIILKNNGTLN